MYPCTALTIRFVLFVTLSVCVSRSPAGPFLADDFSACTGGHIEYAEKSIYRSTHPGQQDFEIAIQDGSVGFAEV